MKAKILIIDDEPQFERLILQLFRKKVKAGTYEFVFARDGQEALEVIEEDQGIHMALTDINMPKMDGLTFLSKLRQIRPALISVIVSAYGDMKNIRTAMNLGAFDFVTKPIEFKDLEKTIEKTLQEAAVHKKAEQAKELEGQNEHLQELDQLKTRFFTNISHEFRTPLTVIKGMADQIEENPERWAGKGVSLIKRNTNNLLDLVNQILELSKLETGKLALTPIQGNIIAYVSYIMDSFHTLAEAKDIRLHFLPGASTLEMDYDPEKFLRILSNLLDNAIKFTPAGGHIYVSLREKEGQLALQVKDTGVGIPDEQLPHIFERFFYRPDSYTTSIKGSGVGLSLVKELTLLMGGTIAVESQRGEGTTFHLTLPITQEADPTQESPEQQSISGTITEHIPSIPLSNSRVEASEELPALLIIEDNEDVAQYLYACLEGRYQLEMAKDGQEGIEKALAQIPDVVISDIMMPRKNGYEVCEVLKKDQRTSHIPIVLLTAKADTESRIAGIEHGADAYMLKPFEKKELTVQLENLLELREQLQSRYRQLDQLPSQDTASNQEDEFIISLRTTVEENMEDEDFGIRELCQAMAMSRTQLHRKIKALTGRSTSSYVRYLRLIRAKKILSSTDWNISQIAYEVGFKDPKYFSRTFSEEFGESPKSARSKP